MSTRSLHSRWLAAAFGLFFMGGCDENLRGTFVAGGNTVPSPILVVSLVPTAIGFETLPAFGCPAFAPFRSTVSIFIDRRGGLDLTLNEVLFQFVDGSGFGSTVRFGQNDLNSMFGIPFIASGTSRLFTFRPSFGCGFFSAPRSLSARVLLLDRGGNRQMQRLDATFR